MPTHPNGSQRVDFEVRRSDWREHRLALAPLPSEPAAGRVLLRVDRFALTSNNVSYALAGDLLGYWKFFPAQAGWGRIPVMGFADVVASRHPKVRESERVFGFFPMSTHLEIEADDAGPASFLDAASHRRDTALAYRQYLRTTADPLYRPAHEDALLLLRGLFLTSVLVDDFLAAAGDFGARSFVLSSASSKTAIALAHRLARRKAGVVVGLTSPRNRDFVASLGCYDRVVLYGEDGTLPADGAAVFVDHSGDGAVVDAVHRRFAERLVYSCSVGATHWNAGPRAQALPGAPPTFFFAPAQIEKRTKEWGPAGFQERLGAAWEDFRAASEGWLQVVRGAGPDAVARVYEEVLEGRSLPRDGHILTLFEGRP
jgi:hypothetical protein